jgi:UMF1 family MFS transporter
MTASQATVNDKREIFGWAMYDWANSAFSTTVGTVFLSPYVADLARSAAEATGSQTVSLLGIPVAPGAVVPFSISLSVVLQAGFLPILGAIADYSHRRKQMLQIFATIGSIATMAMFFVQGNLWWLGALLFMIANLAFGAALVFYNAYLPDIASEEERDRVSSYGFSMGYLGGFILLALNLALYQLRAPLGIPDGLSVRINLASAGIWWLGFSMVTWKRLRSRHAVHALPEGENLLSVAFKQLSKTMEAPPKLIAFLFLLPLAIFIWAPLIAPSVIQLMTVQELPVELAILPLLIPMFGPIIMLVIFLRRKAKTMPETSKYLTAYLIYNDGIQTVIAVASTFAAEPILLGGLGLSQDIRIAVILMVQFVAFGGALLWGKLAKWIGAKQAILVSLVIWAGVVIYAYGGMKGESATAEFFVLAVFIAIVLGGSQAISRSLFAQMIPKSKEAEFFSIYEISERGTSWLGTMVFALAVTLYSNYRIAILSLIAFFIIGLIILPFVNTSKAITDAKQDSAH